MMNENMLWDPIIAVAKISYLERGREYLVLCEDDEGNQYREALVYDCPADIPLSTGEIITVPQFFEMDGKTSMPLMISAEIIE